jgi:phospholipid/cholesterol/gamma-HCH transport system substrate-binding protein
MGSKISPTVIGTFVVGAIALAVVSVLLFSSGKLFQEKAVYVIFFDGSVQGLNVGAPVVFRGVQVGQVTKIEALYDPKETTIHVKVTVELVRGTIQVPEEVQQTLRDTGVELMVQRGLRASLQTQSIVTGLLLVSLDFHPNTPIKRLGLDPTHPELPTVPTEIQQLLDNVRQALTDLSQLPLDALLSEAVGVLTRVNTLLDVPELRQILVSLNDMLMGARQLLHNADGQVVPLGAKLAGAAEAARAAMDILRLALTDAQKLVRNADGQIAPLSTSAKDTLAAARSALGQAQKSLVTLTDAATPALKQAEKAMAGATTLTNPDAALFNDLSHTLKALEEAAKSIRILADSLQRNPEALLRGKR